MGLFGNKIRRIISEIRRMSEYYSNDLSKNISESLEDLESEYEENSSVISEFAALVNELKPKLSNQDASKLEAFSSRISRVNRNAKHGVDALYELSRSQRKITTESLREIGELEYDLR